MRTLRVGKRGIAVLLTAPVLALLLIAAAAEVEFFGFLDNPEQLQPSPQWGFDSMYVKPGAFEAMAGYDAVMIEQPEIFLHPDSKYQGIKPDAWKVLADGFREAQIQELEGAYRIVDEPGPGVLYIRYALGNVMLKRKWSKNPLNYTPVGAAKNAIKKKLSDDITKKTSLAELTIELEVLDSVTGERLVAGIDTRKKKVEATSWEAIEEYMHVTGKLLRCRLDNARRPSEQWENCVEKMDELNKS